jgi:hypothetical protein
MTKHSTQHNVNEAFERMGFVSKRMPPDFRKMLWLLQCSKCPEQFSAHWGPGASPEAMAGQTRKRGWDVGYGMRPLCPKCAHHKDKGPNPKPEHQSFARWIPPQTAISAKLMDAALHRSVETQLPKLRAEAIDAVLDFVEARAEKRALTAEEAEAARLARQRASAAHARAMRNKRLADAKLAGEAGEEALRLAKLKERCGTEAPADVIIPAPQVDDAPQAQEESSDMKNGMAPAPKISHAVFQSLDSVFDPIKRLYRSGYTDQRVARDCGTTEEVVAYLRTETFGALAEDPRLTSLRDDVELLRMESAETFAKLQKQLGEIASRVEQIARS